MPSTENHRSLIIGFVVLVVVVIVGFAIMAKTDVKGRPDAGKTSALDPKKMTEEAAAKGYEVHFLGAAELSKVEHHNDYVVMYYADWCGYCRQALPAFLEASRITGDALMYAVESRNIPKGHPVGSFPTVIRYHTDGRTREVHKGPRTPAGYASFATTH
jgi:thiol-disulfide isomerase/thioredoxin